MVTRGVVVMFKVLLWARLLRLGIGFPENAQAAPAGKPVQEPSETDSGMTPVGVTVMV